MFFMDFFLSLFFGWGCGLNLVFNTNFIFNNNWPEGVGSFDF